MTYQQTSPPPERARRVGPRPVAAAVEQQRALAEGKVQSSDGSTTGVPGAADGRAPKWPLSSRAPAARDAEHHRGEMSPSCLPAARARGRDAPSTGGATRARGGDGENPVTHVQPGRTRRRHRPRCRGLRTSEEPDADRRRRSSNDGRVDRARWRPRALHRVDGDGTGVTTPSPKQRRAEEPAERHLSRRARRSPDPRAVGLGVTSEGARGCRPRRACPRMMKVMYFTTITSNERPDDEGEDAEDVGGRSTPRGRARST